MVDSFIFEMNEKGLPSKGVPNNLQADRHSTYGRCIFIVGTQVKANMGEKIRKIPRIISTRANNGFSFVNAGERARMIF